MHYISQFEFRLQSCVIFDVNILNDEINFNISTSEYVWEPWEHLTVKDHCPSI